MKVVTVNRIERLLQGIDKSDAGIEIAPWMYPIAPKRAGYNVLTLDVFPTEVLRRNAKSDSNIPDEDIVNIENVDIVGSADDIGIHISARGLEGKLDYVLSSHNFEHLPNPILFLQGCERALANNGALVMALPDYRACFDYFRPYTTTAEVIAAYFAERRFPTAAQLFMQNSQHSRYCTADGRMELSFSLDYDVRAVKPLPGLRVALETWRERITGRSDGGYRDAHCWAFSPSSFALIIGDLNHLGFTTLVAEEVSATVGHEFYVRLRKGRLDDREDSFYARREELMHATKDEAAENTRLVQLLRRELNELREATRQAACPA